MPDFTREEIVAVVKESEKFEGANLADIDLSGADLWKAHLRGANLIEADLRLVDLWKADLRGADLRRVDLRKADLSKADLRSANLSGANLHEAWYNRHTTFPDGFDPQKVGMLPLYDGELPKGSH